MKNSPIKRCYLVAAFYLFFSSHLSAQQRAVKSEDPNEISRDIAISTETTLLVKNLYRTIEIEQWDQPKIRMAIRLDPSSRGNLSDPELLKKLGLSTKEAGNKLVVESNYQSDRSPDGTSSEVSKEDKAVLALRIPYGQKLEIENTYGKIKILSEIKRVAVKMSNGFFEAKNIGHLILDSKYSDFYGGNISSAEVTFSNGNFKARDIGDLSIYSETSTIIAGDVKKAFVKSTNDYYELIEVGTLECVKTFNVLLIDKLISSIRVDGSSADIRIRKFSPTAEAINIKDRYCSLRLSISDLENYVLSFEGMYTTAYGDFERKEVPVNHEIKHYSVPIKGVRVKSKNTTGTADTIPQKQEQDLRKPIDRSQRSDPTKFIASKGDGSGPDINVECYNCRVDFN